MSFSGFRPRTPSLHNFPFASFAPILAGFIFWHLALAPLDASATVNQVIHEGSFDAKELRWETDPTGVPYPELDGTRLLAQPGLPQIPARDMVFLVPLDSDVIELWIEPLATHRVAVEISLALAPPHISDSGEIVSQAGMSRQGPEFPGAWGEYTGQHVWRGYRLATVTVFPVREINTDQGVELEFLDSFAVRMSTRDRNDQDAVAVRQRSVPGEAEDHARILSSLVANPLEIPGYHRQHGQDLQEKSAPFQPTQVPSLNGSGVTYLIITNEDLRDRFQILADHKTALGIPSVVVTREFITANFRNGADIQETMRMYIREAYEKWGVEYVLLGGDSDILPPRYVDNYFYPTVGYTSVPVDLYFSCLDGNWNADGDSNYGEPAANSDPGDLVDFAEEVYIGRATVSNVAEAQVFVNKVISYESVDETDDWANRALFAAEVLFPEDYPEGNYIILDGAQYADQQINENIIPCTGMEYMRMYQTDTLFPWDTQLSRMALIDTLNSARYGILNQIGHGSFFNMSVSDANFMTFDADLLTNGDHQFMIYALNCASGAFDKACLLERFVKNPNGGSVCSIGSARAAFPNNSNNYQQEFFSQLYCNGEMRVGRMVALSRLPFIGLTSADYVDRWTFENYTLLGDPTLPIWSGTPVPVEVAGPAGMGLGPQMMAFTVTEGGNPLENALVCLAKDGESHARGFTDALGMVNLNLHPTSTGSATLTVSGKNLVTKKQLLPVTSNAAFTSLSMMNVDDGTVEGSFGNENQYVEGGESVALTAQLTETGGAGTGGMTGVLSCSDAAVIILTDTASFPAVSAGGDVIAQSPFMVHFNADLPDASEITFQLEVADGAATYVSEWKVVVNAPVLNVVSMDWEDQTFGNGDGIQDPGERIRITARLKNFGSGTADGITGYLRSDEANVVLYDSVATWTGLEHLDELSGSITYSLSVANLTAGDTSRFEFVDNYGRSFIHEFSPGRPAVPGDLTTDTSLGPDVIALAWSPPASSNIFGYNVYRSKNEAGPFIRVNQDVIAGVSYYRDENLDQLTWYYFKVAAVDSSRVPSGLSDPVACTTAPAEREGFPVSFTGTTSGHLAVGDVDGDGDHEIVLANDQVYVFNHDGQELLDGDGQSQTLGVFSDFPTGYILQPAGIAMANLNGVFGEEIVVSEISPGIRIHILTKDGTELPGWPQDLATTQLGTKWNWATPAVGDIDGDNEPEIVVHALNGVIYAWHVDGSEVRDGDNNPATNGVFFVRAGAHYEWSRSGPALYDLDHDGGKDIIFGTRNDDTGLKRLMALRHDGTNVPGFPYIANGGISVDPCVGDLDNDLQVEIIFSDSARYLYAVKEDGTNYPGFPRYMGYTALHDWVSSPGLADMDGDGMLEIIHAPNESGSVSRIVVVDTDYSGGTSGQTLPGWPVTLPGSSEGSPVIGDINGDLVLDIVYGIGGGDLNAPFNLYAFSADGSPVNGFPITLTGPLMPSSVITDIDRDGDVDIVFGGWDSLIHVWDMPFPYDRHFVPWPTFGGNNRRDGVLFPIDLVPVEDPEEVPMASFTVTPVYPNPFNPLTTVRLYIPTSSELDVAVFDVLGRRVRSLHSGGITSGWHTFVWNGKDDEGRGQASGMYFLRAKNRGEVSVQKVTLVK